MPPLAGVAEPPALPAVGVGVRCAGAAAEPPARLGAAEVAEPRVQPAAEAEEPRA